MKDTTCLVVIKRRRIHDHSFRKSLYRKLSTMLIYLFLLFSIIPSNSISSAHAQNQAPIPVIDISSTYYHVDYTVQFGAWNSQGTNLTYFWELISKPAGSIGFDPSGGVDFGFVPDVAGDYVIQLTVIDEFNVSRSATVSFAILPRLRTIYVPDDFPDIQAAITYIESSNEIVDSIINVRSGTYGSFLLDGAASGSYRLKVKSESGADTTFIDGGISCGGWMGLEIDGFTIQNGMSGITAYNCSLNIKNNIITSNMVTGGVFINNEIRNDWPLTVNIENNIISNNGDSGIVFSGGALNLFNNKIFDNYAYDAGGGAYIHGGNESKISMANNVFTGNSAGNCGGSLYVVGAHVDIVNSTFFNNISFSYTPDCAGGIHNVQATINMTNSILRGNIGFDEWGESAERNLHNESGGQTSINYSNLGDDLRSTVGEGNIFSDPLFIDPYGSYDFRLQANSPCIDAGSNNVQQIPAKDIEGHARISDGNGDGVAIIDMGAYEYPHNTQVGTNIIVKPIDSTTGASSAVLTFSEITQTGITTITSSSTGPAIPSGYNLGNPPTYYDINTTAVYQPPITVCFNYEPLQFTDLSSLRLLHYEGNAWADVTASNDTNNHVICGQVNSLSPFVIAQYSTHQIVQASIEINPVTLNLGAKGVFTSFITLSGNSNYTLVNIDTSSLVCEGAPVVNTNMAANKLIAKFNVEDLKDIQTGNNITLTITGKFKDGRPFKSSYPIRVIGKKK